LLTLSQSGASQREGSFYDSYLGSGRNSTARTRQWTDEVQAGAATMHGDIFRDPFGTVGCQDRQAAVFVDAGLRSPKAGELLKDGWKSVGKVFILAIVLDVVYQIIELHFVYVGEAIIVAFILAFLPYLILRGLVTRIARRKIVPASVKKSV
jgi:hypothetical protein